jgi:hypothetical protein
MARPKESHPSNGRGRITNHPASQKDRHFVKSTAVAFP